MKPATPRKFQTRIGVGIFIPLILLFGFLFYFFAKHSSFSGLIIVVFTFGFLLYLILSIQYRVMDNFLEISCGFLIHKKIRINRIQRIKKVKNWLAAPAASVNRLQIFYNQQESISISPKHTDEFIKSLLDLNPDIIIL